MKLKLSCLFLLLFLGSLSGVSAQSAPPTLIRCFTVPSPTGYGSRSNAHWSPDGQLIAISFAQENTFDQGIWLIYEIATGTLLQQVTDFFAWYPDSQRALIRQIPDQPPQIMAVRTGRILGTLYGATSTFTGAPTYNWEWLVQAVIPNLDDRAHILRLYDSENGALLLTVPDYGSYLPVFSPDGALVAMNTRTGLLIYNTADYSLVQSLPDFRYVANYNSSWSSDSQRLLIVSSADDYLNGPYYIWQTNGERSAPIYNRTGAFVWSPDSLVLALPSDFDKVRLYDGFTGDLLETIRGFPAGPTDVVQWTDSYLLTSSGTYSWTSVTISVWNTTTHAFLVQQGVDLTHPYQLQGDQFRLFDPLWSGMYGGTLSTGEIVHEFEMDPPGLSYLSPDWRWFVIFRYPPGEPAQVYGTDPYQQIAVMEEAPDSIVWSPDSQHFASINESKVTIWEVIEE